MIRVLLATTLLCGCLEDEPAPEAGDPAAGGDAADGGEDTPFVCVGATPAEGARTASSGPIRELDEEGAPVEPTRDTPVEVGEETPPWTLADFQPQSCGYESTYGMEAYKGRVTVVALLAAG